jgi:hypothetical protein
VASDPPRFILLVHQIPPRPSYLRVKIGRRLQALGAVAVKNSVYVLPRSESALEDFQWLRREILAGRGEATIMEARFLEGHTDAEVEALFTAAREGDYAALAREAGAVERSLGRAPRRGRAEPPRQALARLRRRLAEVRAIDFFGAPGREAVEGMLDGVEARLRPRAPSEAPPAGRAGRGVRGCTWVTRRGIHVDRMASAWLVRRFVDRAARFKFVPGQVHAPRQGEQRFDMSPGEFTHEGDLCTFEVILLRFGLHDPALRHIGEVVHDIDLKDAKFGRPEAAGLDCLVAGIALRHGDDQARLREASAVFDAFYESLRRKR